MKAWKGACLLAASCVRAEMRRLDGQAKRGLLVDPEQRRHLGRLADWLLVQQHAGPEVLGPPAQDSLEAVRERAQQKLPVGFRQEGKP